MKDGRLQVAQVGCGAFAEGQDFTNFANNRHTVVTWCCDLSRDRAQAMADTFGIPNVAVDYRDAIRDPAVDLIKIATSHEIHLPIIEAAAAVGKHVFCEKPMAMEEPEALKIIRVVRKHGIKLCVDLNRRGAPAMQALRNRWQAHKADPRHQPWRYVEMAREPLPEEGQTQFLVRVQDESMSYRLVHLDPLRGGGQIIGESVHYLDMACWFFAPQIPVEIQAWGSTRLSHGIHLTFSGGDTATILFNCGGTFDYPKELYEVTHNGALLRSLCFVENEYFGMPGQDRETFALQHDVLPEVGTEGGWSGYMAKYRARVEGQRRNAKAGYVTLAVDKGHQAMLDGFVDAILNDRPSPCDELAGLASVYLARRAIQSIEQGMALPVPIERLQPCLVEKCSTETPRKEERIR